ncbi:MAG TPA: RnfABCDGE type electron transport complex subunit D [Spirochaetia bacterium]|nr:RnfABCDGE type electron transport complex subunit D [Spirochaetia bacterium]
MSARTEGFLLTSSPHQFSESSTNRIMYVVILTLLPAVIMSVLYFGAYVLLLYAVGIGAAMATEVVTKLIRKKNWRTISDGSAVITGLLLVMSLPPRISPLLVGLGSVVAIFIGKELFGGLGANVFNPALVGRAFLAAAYPVPMTTWLAPNALFGFLGRVPDATTSATPLSSAKFEHTFESVGKLFLGQTGGSIGETAALFIILGGLVLILLRIVRWRTVVSYLGTVFLLGGLFWVINPSLYPSPVFQLFAGGLMLGAFYMATDMVTSPYTHLGSVIFGMGAGVLVVIIRLFGGFPEGVMYSILLMNAITPLLNRSINNKVFGRRPNRRGEGRS